MTDQPNHPPSDTALACTTGTAMQILAIGMPNKGPRTLQERLAAYRCTQALTEVDLAAQLTCSPAVLHQMMLGRMRIPLSMVEPIAALLELDRFEAFDIWLQDGQPVLHQWFRQFRDSVRVSDGELRMLRNIRSLADGGDTHAVVLDSAGAVAVVFRTALAPSM